MNTIYKQLKQAERGQFQICYCKCEFVFCPSLLGGGTWQTFSDWGSRDVNVLFLLCWPRELSSLSSFVIVSIYCRG